VRATKTDNDELGLLTDAFNHMLIQIQEQNSEITSFNQKLEQKVIERTREIEIANKELEAFSYSVSHDLRAPLRSIHGYMNIFHEEYADKFDDEANRLINIIIKNAKKMGQLIDDLLAFSRMGRKEISRVPVDFNKLVEPVITELKNNTPDKTKFILHVLHNTQGDPSLIAQVYANLISNAIKYSGNREHPRIETGAFIDKEQTTFFIKDNGVGFDEKYKEKLFKVFQRLHRSAEFEGTGVGLAIVEKIISKHGGKVWAEGTVAKGASFYFSLPG
jgi:light-regulated signal transduction histidine kinase (bacteriophytochrome)